MRVLVTDDSGVMRKIIVRSLNAVGVTDCAEAVNGVDALTQYQAGQFDLIITDWNMPEKNGLELVTELRALGATLPIIMVTTETQKNQVIKAIMAGVTDYLTKPFDNDVLRAKLDKYVAI